MTAILEVFENVVSWHTVVWLTRRSQILSYLAHHVEAEVHAVAVNHVDRAHVIILNTNFCTFANESLVVDF